MGFWENFLILFAISCLVCLSGFYKYLYFISVGYGFSVAAIGIALSVLFYDKLTLATVILSAILVIYGVRLGGYLLLRDVKSDTYKKAMKKEFKKELDTKIVPKICTWLSCALLYVLQTMPILCVLQNGDGVHTVTYIGALISVAGIIIESVADAQKSKFKRENPQKFCNRGLFRIVRCPNYFGEILVWTGVFVSGVTSFEGVAQWALAILGYVCIVYIVFGGARRLELRQDKNYGDDEEYLEYARKKPIIIPLLPIYSVKKHKWLIG